MSTPDVVDHSKAPFAIDLGNSIAHSVTQQARFELTEWLPLTKFQPPSTHRALMVRPQLLTLLHQSVSQYRLTLISAPAGSGKTTLLTQWIATYAQQAVAWLHLDRQDDQPTIFVVALVRALATISNGFGDNLLTWVATADQFASLTSTNSIHQAIGLLINEVAQSITKPFTLILDDCHYLEHPANFAGLEYLLENMPAQMSLILATRHDPPLALDRLRGQGELAEFRFEHLAFSHEEVERFIHSQLEISLAPNELYSAMTQTQGWPAGVRLLANALIETQVRDRANQSIAHVAHHNLSQKTAPVMNTYLLNEVLNRQPLDVRSFLLQTSLLSELTPALCQAVTGQSDAADQLERLYHANLFITRTNGGEGKHNTPPVYRYHDLFADFLRQRLQIEMADQLATLHQRAAWAETGLERKFAHFLAGKWWEPAAQLLSDVGEHLLQQGLLDTLYGWLVQFPNDVRVAHPQLLYLLGVCQWQQRAFQDAHASLLQAMQAFQAAGDHKNEGAAMVHLASCAMFANRFAEALQWTERALALPISTISQVQLLMSRLWLGYNHAKPNWKQVEQDFAHALEITKQNLDRTTLRAITSLCGAAIVKINGGLAGIEWITTLSREQRPAPDPFWELVVTLLRAWYEWIRGHPEAFERESARCLALSDLLAHTHHPALYDLYVLRIIILGVQEEYAFAYQIVSEKLQNALTSPMFQAALVATYFMECRLHWQAGNVVAAKETYQRALLRFGEEVMPAMRLCIPAMHALLALSERQYTQAEKHLQDALALEMDSRSGALMVQPRILRAYLHIQWKGPHAGLALFIPILKEHEQNNTPGLLAFAGTCVIPLLKLAVRHNLHAEFALRVLALLKVKDATEMPLVTEEGESLSVREVEVLRLISTGASNNEIVVHLGITLPTVKTHITHIFQKLGVTSRKAAAARAQELGLRRFL